MQQIQAEKQQERQQHKKLSTQNPYVEWAMWLVKPPSMSSGKTEYVVKRIVTAPIRYVCIKAGAVVHGFIVRSKLTAIAV